MARANSSTSSINGGTTGQGSGTKRPSGKGAWRSSATSSRTQPWRNTLTSRRRGARRVRRRSGHPPVTSSRVLAGLALPPGRQQTTDRGQGTRAHQHHAAAPQGHHGAWGLLPWDRCGMIGGPPWVATGLAQPGCPPDGCGSLPTPHYAVRREVNHLRFKKPPLVRGARRPRDRLRRCRCQPREECRPGGLRRAWMTEGAEA